MRDMTCGGDRQKRVKVGGSPDYPNAMLMSFFDNNYDIPSRAYEVRSHRREWFRNCVCHMEWVDTGRGVGALKGTW